MVQSVEHDLAFSWLFRPLEQRNIGKFTYLLICCCHLLLRIQKADTHLTSHRG